MTAASKTPPSRGAASRVPLCLDGRMLSEEGTGVTSYARGLNAALALLGGGPPWVLRDRQGEGVGQIARERPRVERWRRWLATRTARPVTVAPAGDALVGRDLFRRAQRHFREHGTLLRVRAPGVAPGIMHWTYPLPIVLDGWANLYTVHDAIPFTHPDLSPIDPAKHRRLLTAIGAHAAAILTVSDAAAQAIAASGAVGPAPIINTGQMALPPELQGDLPAGFSPQAYFLVCGAVEPRKNIAALVTAWRASGTALPLVVAGPDGWRADELGPLLRGEGVVRLPYQPRAALSALMAGARALLFPSLAEGFGLPIVEAMALGTPVMTSTGGSTGEIAGGAALLVDARDVDAMSAAIARLDRDASLRERLAAAGPPRAAHYSLERFAEQLDAVHRSLIVNPR